MGNASSRSNYNICNKSLCWIIVGSCCAISCWGYLVAVLEHGVPENFLLFCTTNNQQLVKGNFADGTLDETKGQLRLLCQANRLKRKYLPAEFPLIDVIYDHFYNLIELFFAPDGYSCFLCGLMYNA